MDDTTQTILQGLKAAILAETEGHHFYLMAARTTSDEQGQRIFEQLAQEELQHVQFLQSQYRSFLETGGPDASLALGTPTALDSQSPIFSDQIKGRIAEAHFEMTALSVGIQLELSAQRYYSEAAVAAADPAVKQFYTELAEWESAHYHALLAQQESLKEDYWSAGGFAPF